MNCERTGAPRHARPGRVVGDYLVDAPRPRDPRTDTALAALRSRLLAQLSHEIEMVERNRAILKPPGSLDAWEAHHRGLWHMYRFNKADNEQARHFFDMAIRLDPTFSRAYAGLSSS